MTRRVPFVVISIMQLAVLLCISSVGYAEPQTRTSATIHWQTVSGALRYVLNIARKPDMSQIFLSTETIQRTYESPPLSPGTYYYQAIGYAEEREMGRTTVQSFVVAKPLTVTTNKKIKLEAPPIIAPKHMELFPSHGKVRLAWQGVPGAKSYRFRLWDEQKAKRNKKYKLPEPPPRWETEVDKTWIEVLDAPYSSFMFLDSGTYRWDVAAIDPDNKQIGDIATGFFEVGKQWYLSSKELYFRFQYGLSPNAQYTADSSISGTQSRFASTSHRFDGEAEYFVTKQFGLNLGAGVQTFEMGIPERSPIENFYFWHYNFDLLYRAYLSNHIFGWTFVGGAGLGFQEFPSFDNYTKGSLTVSRPRAMGLHLKARFEKRWEGPWEMQFQLSDLIHAKTQNGPTSNAQTGTTLDAEFIGRAVYHWSPTYATALALSYEYKYLRYTPDPYWVNSNVLLANWYLALLFEFKYNYK